MSETLHSGVDADTPSNPELTPSTVETPAILEAEPVLEASDPDAMNDEVLGELAVDSHAALPIDPTIDPEIAAEVDAETEEKAVEPTPVPVEVVAEKAAPAPAATVEEAKAEVELAKPVEPVEPAQPEESFADIFSEFQRTHVRREEGASQIRGTVVAVTEDSVLVDIGFKSEGILPLAMFASAKEIGRAHV